MGVMPFIHVGAGNNQVHERSQVFVAIEVLQHMFTGGAA
jgi:hypothetical protein